MPIKVQSGAIPLGFDPRRAVFSLIPAKIARDETAMLVLGLSRTWGRVEPGYTANLVMLNADPLANISNTRNIDSVVVNGVLLSRVQLDELLGDAKARK
jgi:hypothetical protein